MCNTGNSVFLLRKQPNQAGRNNTFLSTHFVQTTTLANTIKKSYFLDLFLCSFSSILDVLLSFADLDFASFWVTFSFTLLCLLSFASGGNCAGVLSFLSFLEISTSVFSTLTSFKITLVSWLSASLLTASVLTFLVTTSGFWDFFSREASTAVSESLTDFSLTSWPPVGESFSSAIRGKNSPGPDKVSERRFSAVELAETLRCLC